MSAQHRGCPVEEDGYPYRDGGGDVGPKTAEKLAAAGIESVEDLRAAEPEEVAGSVDGVSADRVREWQTAARA